jgi:N-acetylneuraminate epimerase
MLCIGGGDAATNYADVFLLQWRNGSMRRRSFPALPAPRGNMAAAILGNIVYVAGGAAGPDATEAASTFWSIDLGSKSPRWKNLETWPGPARMLGVAAVQGNSFLLFSGVELRRGGDGKPARSYLRDAFRYTPGAGWKKLAPLPRAAAGAPSPAPTMGSRVVVISGDDGALVDFEPKSKHPGFPRNALVYDPVLGWSQIAAPLSRATVTAVSWRGRVIIPNGETRPGVRTAEVWTLEGNTRD